MLHFLALTLSRDLGEILLEFTLVETHVNYSITKPYDFLFVITLLYHQCFRPFTECLLID